MNVWTSIFFQSPVNEGRYDERELPQFKWEWPSETWFQSRLNYLRDHEPRQVKLRRNLHPKANSTKPRELPCRV